MRWPWIWLNILEEDLKTRFFNGTKSKICFIYVGFNCKRKKSGVKNVWQLCPIMSIIAWMVRAVVSYFAKTLALQSLAGIESLRFCGLPAEGAGLSKAYWLPMGQPSEGDNEITNSFRENLSSFTNEYSTRITRFNEHFEHLFCILYLLPKLYVLIQSTTQ